MALLPCSVSIATISTNKSHKNLPFTCNNMLSSKGEWEGVVQVQPWGDCGDISRCQGPRRGAGHQADPQRPPSGNPRGGRVHSDRHHLRTHHGAGKAPAVHPSCAWRLSLPALWQVRASEMHLSTFSSAVASGVPKVLGSTFPNTLRRRNVLGCWFL